MAFSDNRQVTILIPVEQAIFLNEAAKLRNTKQASIAYEFLMAGIRMAIDCNAEFADLEQRSNEFCAHMRRIDPYWKPAPSKAKLPDGWPNGGTK